MTRPHVDQETFKKNNHKVHHNNPTGKSTDLQEFLFEKQREFFRSVFSSAEPVTLVDVLGNILNDNELSHGTNVHRVITSDKTCGSGRPDSWGLLYAQWTRDRWCGRHRKGRCAAQEGRTIFRCFGIRRSFSFGVSSGVRYHCGIVCNIYIYTFAQPVHEYSYMSNSPHCSKHVFTFHSPFVPRSCPRHFCCRP
jgi:hypothetical protein